MSVTLSPVRALRGLRHGSLKSLDPFWVRLGRVYRAALRVLPFTGPTRQWIGPFGPYRMDARFAFSDFAGYGGADNRVFAACIEACRDKTCVFDVGAYIGLGALPMASVLAPGGRVYAFEAAEANRRCLTRHLMLNRIVNVQLVHGVVGAEDLPAARFFEESRPSTLNSIVGKGGNARFLTVHHRQLSLDGVARTRVLAPEVIRIDVGGGEMAVLLGAREVLARARPTVFLTVYPRQLERIGGSAEALHRLIGELGYLCRDLDGRVAGRLQRGDYRLDPIAPRAAA